MGNYLILKDLVKVCARSWCVRSNQRHKPHEREELEFNESGIPNTFVPARNLLFSTFAAAIAYRRSIKHIVLGVCETDYSGYYRL